MRPTYFIHDFDRIAIRLGDFEISWYSSMWLLVMISGCLLWYWQARRGGFSRRVTFIAIPWVVFAYLLGIRLVHCLVYAPEYYFADPIRFLEFWNGGFASHGAVIGAALGFYTFCRKFRTPFLDMFDRFCFSGCLGAALVRVGNFMNGEIVGVRTEVSWGMRFMSYDAGNRVRHPVQLYECGLALITLVAILIADRLAGGEKRPRGLMVAMCLVIYFGGRYFIEFYKERLTLHPDDSFLTMGQWLSLPAVFVGLAMLFDIWDKKTSTR